MSISACPELLLYDSSDTRILVPLSALPPQCVLTSTSHVHQISTTQSTMLLGIGVDILSLARLQGVTNRRGADKLAQRICCARELAEFRKLPAESSPSSSSSSSTSSGNPSPSNISSSSLAQASPPAASHPSLQIPATAKQIRFLASRYVFNILNHTVITHPPPRQTPITLQSSP